MKWIACLAAFAGIGFLQAQQAEENPGDLIWWNVENFGVEGQGWPVSELESPYDRLPTKAQDIVRGAVWNLSRHSTGLSFQFQTDADEFTIRYEVGDAKLAKPHMPATGASGLDLYAKTDQGKWRWVDAAKPTRPSVELKIRGIASGQHTFLAYLPLFNSVKMIEIGIPKGKRFESIEPRKERPIVFYGTSITHGASASRPGMTHVAILGRRLNRPVVNLGFSGNGKMEPELTALLAELDPAAYVIDCLPNMTESDVASNAGPLVTKLREIRPDVPIVLVEDRSYANSWIYPSLRLRNQTSREALAKVYQDLSATGLTNLFYVEGESLLGEDGEATTDGSHPSDLGFVRQADALERVLREALE